MKHRDPGDENDTSLAEQYDMPGAHPVQSNPPAMLVRSLPSGRLYVELETGAVCVVEEGQHFRAVQKEGTWILERL